MGVDYASVSGIGLRVTAEVQAKFMATGLFTEAEWDVNPNDLKVIADMMVS